MLPQHMNYCTEVLYTILDYAFETLQLLLKKRFKINTGRAIEVSVNLMNT